MPQTWTAYLNQALKLTAEFGRTRVRRPLDLEGMIDFGSNDYLSLRKHPKVLAALNAASNLTGAPWGAGASPVLSGYSQQHASLESALAKFSSTSAALVFSSGFAGHSGSVACLAGPGDLILSDQLNHASLIDGCRLSRASTVIYPHADADFVREYLQQNRHQFAKVLLLSESIFSMDGDSAPLESLADVAQHYDTGLVVDEAHAVGVYGPRGGGLLEELNLQSHALAKFGTLSKALGGVGGYVAGDENLIGYLVNHCRSYLFSTAAPGLAQLAALRSLQLLVNMHDERQA
ncbi:MAG: aminotransferase class I/II-fold pyridoxal phosphate-dependent enzyme, partial [Aureliella sp.]